MVGTLQRARPGHPTCVRRGGDTSISAEAGGGEQSHAGGGNRRDGQERLRVEGRDSRREAIIGAIIACRRGRGRNHCRQKGPGGAIIAGGRVRAAQSLQAEGSGRRNHCRQKGPGYAIIAGGRVRAAQSLQAEGSGRRNRCRRKGPGGAIIAGGRVRAAQSLQAEGSGRRNHCRRYGREPRHFGKGGDHWRPWQSG